MKESGSYLQSRTGNGSSTWLGQGSLLCTCMYVQDPRPTEGKVRSQDAKQGTGLRLGGSGKGMVVAENTSRKQSFEEQSFGFPSV